MMTKIHRRLFKEGILGLRRSSLRSAACWPKCFLDSPHTLPELARLIRLLHGADELPWPHERGLLLAPFDWYHRSIRGESSNSLSMIARGLPLPAAFDLQFEFDHLGPCRIVRREYLAGHRVSLLPGDCLLARLSSSEGIREHLCVHDDLAATDDPEILRDLMEFTEASLPAEKSSGIWVTISMTKTRGWAIVPATVILACLASCAAPCGYFVRVSFPKGFGGTADRRDTAGTTVNCQVSYDRLHGCYINCGIKSEHEVAPHDRRGHWRHHWAEAGLNRMDLPDRADLRAAIVETYKVRRSYIHPTWVGARDFGDEECTFHIEQGESDLNTRGSVPGEY